MREIKVEMGRGLGDSGVLPRVGAVLILIDNRRDQEQHFDVIGISAEPDRLLPDVVTEFLHRGDAAGRGDDGLGPPRGEGAAARGTAGLANDGMTLRRARSGQRSARAEVFALEVNWMDLGGIGEDLSLLVDHHRIGLPGVPELLHDLYVLIGHLVTLVMRILPFEAKVLRAAIVAAGHEIPAGAAVADMIQRVGQPREHEGVIFGR